MTWDPTSGNQNPLGPAAPALAALYEKLPPEVREFLAVPQQTALGPAPLPGANRAGLTEWEQDALKVSTMLGIPPQFVAWQHVPQLSTKALVVHTPWSKVVVARTRTDVHRFLTRWPKGKCPWLYEALCEVYSKALTPALPPPRLSEIPIMDPDVRGFIEWSLQAPPAAYWPLTPTARVLGSWKSWREAVTVDRGDGTLQALSKPDYHPIQDLQTILRDVPEPLVPRAPRPE